MGAWGTGIFDDDTSLDIMDEIEESGATEVAIAEIFEAAVNEEYFHYELAHSVIVAAAYIDRQTNGTRFPGDDEDEPYPVNSFPERYPAVDLAPMKALAVAALGPVLASSELQELWEENKEKYPVWKQGISELVSRLQPV